MNINAINIVTLFPSIIAFKMTIKGVYFPEGISSDEEFIEMKMKESGPINNVNFNSKYGDDS